MQAITRSTRTAALTLGLALGLTPGLRASGLEIMGFTINSAVVISMYNAANQTTQVITEYPKDMDPAVILITVKNSPGGPLQPYFKAVVKDASSGCAGGVVVTSPIIRSKRILQPGETASLNAADFTTAPVQDGSNLVCTDFYNKLKSDFDSSNIAKAVDYLVKKEFDVCLVWCDAGGNPLGDEECTRFSLFTGVPGVKYSTAILVYPHNHPVDGALTFAWAPASHNSLSQAEINYDLEICDELDGTVIHRLRMQPGATFYSWSPSDPVLERDRQYWWRIVSKDLNGVPFGGQGNRGWNVMKWFRVRGFLRASLSQLAELVSRNGDPATQAALKGYVIKGLISPSSIEDPLIEAVAAGRARVTAVRVIK